MNVSAITGRAGIYSAWLNGQFLGSTDDPTHHFGFPVGSVRTSRDNVLSVMVENIAHNEDFNADDFHKQPRRALPYSDQAAKRDTSSGEGWLTSLSFGSGERFGIG